MDELKAGRSRSARHDRAMDPVVLELARLLGEADLPRFCHSCVDDVLSSGAGVAFTMDAAGRLSGLDGWLQRSDQGRAKRKGAARRAVVDTPLHACADQLREILAQNDQGQGRVRFIGYLAERDGCLRRLLVEVRAVNQEGAPSESLRGTMVDVTDRADWLTALMQASDAHKAARLAREEFIAKVQHELRTPLTGIIGLSHIGLLENRDITPKELFAAILESGESLRRAIDSILEFAEHQEQPPTVHVASVALGSLLESLRGEFAARAQLCGIDFGVVAAESLPLVIRADAFRLRQVLQNLLENAFKFTEVGSVQLRVSRDDAGCFQFEVEDTGVGIAPDRIEAVFEPFEQADNSRTRRYGGLGLGLTNARAWVARMGGRLALESTPGRGSRVWFKLPNMPS